MQPVASSRAVDKAIQNPLGPHNTRFRGSLSPASPGHDFLFNHLVGAGEQRERDGEAEGVSSLEVYDKLNCSGPLDWQIARLLAVENFSGIDPDQTVIFCIIPILRLSDRLLPNRVARWT